MIFIGLALTTMLFITAHLIVVTKSEVNGVLEKLNPKEECDCDP